MSCIITVIGDGKGRNGHPKKDRTGPLEEFMVDNIVFYTAVFQHLLSCNKHDPNEILKHYITRRIARGDQMVTGTLVNMALKYARNFKIDQSIINEYKWRNGIDAGVDGYKRRIGLSLYDLAKAVKLQLNTGYLGGLHSAMNGEISDHKTLMALHNIVLNMELDEVLNLNQDGELSKLIEVANVMLT